MNAVDQLEAELALIRSALQSDVEKWNVRLVARQVDVAPGTLQSFLDGSSRPRRSSLTRLRAWYDRRAGVDRAPLAEILADLRRYVGILPNPELGIVRILDSVEAAFEEQGEIAPNWIARCRQELAG